MAGTQPVEVVNATYALLEFKHDGFADPSPHKSSRETNREFFEAVRHSHYDNIDCDPEIRQLREELGDEFSWVPTESELSWMLRYIFSSSEADRAANSED